jgi:hypothetical protein
MIRIAALACALVVPHMAAAAEPEIRTEDVQRFYRLYAQANGHPTAETLQREYLDKGSPGLAQLARLRNITGARIAAAIEATPAVYEDARRCAAHLPRAKARLGAALRKLGQIYPQASFPPVYVVIGRSRPVGVGDDKGVYIGLEALCAWTAPDPNEEDRMVHVIAHEYVHVQQSAAGDKESDEDSVLRVALIEGGAELLAELTSGSISSKHLAIYGRGREREIETEFAKDLDQRGKGSRWVYNGVGTPERPGDLGYWVGYRIAKAYYLKAADKRAAIRDIVELKDPKAFLAASGWTPGMDLGR